MTSPFAKHEARAKEILATMSIEDKVGQMFHSMAFVSDPTGPNGFLDSLTVEQQIREKRLSHFNAIGGAGTPEEMAKWQNQIQAIATDAGLPVPVTISTDPRNHFTNNPGAAMMAGPFSQWPETLGLAAIGDAEIAEIDGRPAFTFKQQPGAKRTCSACQHVDQGEPFRVLRQIKKKGL